MNEYVTCKKKNKIVINILKFKELDERLQRKEITNFIKYISDESDIQEKWIDSSIDLCDFQKDSQINFENIIVLKNNNTLTFKKINKKLLNILKLLVLILLLIVLIILLLYYIGVYNKQKNLNKDINNDGIADLNIDINKDRIADINIDTNYDNKPDLNIDYKHNRKKIFNLDKNNDGVADFNLVHKYQKGKKCGINCDINNDGFPDLNIDIDGDKKADLFIDLDDDLKPDINFDLNGDMKCDLLCDSTGDHICNKYCDDDKNQAETYNPTDNNVNNNINKNNNKNNNKLNVNTNDDEILNISSGGLLITYTNNSTENVLPDDMKDAKPIKDSTILIENTTNSDISYNLDWKVEKNTFKTDNLKFKLTSTDGGVTTEFLTVPKKNESISKNIIIKANTKQNYTLSFILKGTNAEQNIDQQKTFSGLVTVSINQ